MSLPVPSRRRPPPFARENKSSGSFQAPARGAGAAAAMGLLERCRDEFGTADLYEVLGVRREASDGEIRRGYHKVSLRVHPDRVAEAGRQEATRQFQILGKVYAVLSDAEKRAVYDEQGTVDEESEALSQERDWADYWRLLFKKITLEDIQKFEEKYVGSEEELADIKQAYADFEGDMDRIMASVLCAEHSDEPRVRTIIQRAIDSGELPPYKAFLEEPGRKLNARKRRAQKEAKEAEKTRRELGLGDEPGDLTALIQSRQKNRVKEMDSFLAQMEAKYCNSSKRRKTNIKGKK